MRPIPHHLYPFEGKYLDCGGVRMHYLDEGDGENDAVVMVHGNPTWSFYYRNLVGALCSHRRCVVPDHIGCGLSDKPADDRYPYRLERRIEDLGALLDHLALERVDLVVHDWGGMIGLGWAVRNPERVRRLVVLNTGAFHLPAAKKVPWQLRIVRNTPIGVFLVRGLNAFARGATFAAVASTRMARDVRDAYCAPYDSWDNRIATARFVQDIPLQPDDPGYAIVSETARGLAAFADRPIMVFWGMKDFVFDHHFLAEFERVWPNATVRTFPDAGHYVLEDAGDTIIPLVVEFLTR